ncbi:cupin domain-containing protein [Novosphingobium sp. 9U]|uniref:cupin domain-containing protein n=1 Tax=Novosphingobium sp. 9U TaxID=2653158 RepID=UPI0012EFD531|nr:cupin domain-containing protein [Novosphingobium sp. 9U]VWX52800.1 Cupin [Novosphingobium sp. 9U]
MATGDTAQAIIARLDLQPHPEGGWYRQTWRGEDGRDGRASGTAIHFLLEAHQRSHWHKVDAAEIWLWHAGAPITLSIAPGDDGPVAEHRLGPDVLAGEAPQVLVPVGHWQAAAPLGGWALVSCVVVPGFSFNGFELAPQGWAPSIA